MAITIIQKPADYHAGYNPVKFKIDSTNKNKAAFRYVAEIKDNNSNALISSFNIAPDPTDAGRGNIDISKIISNKLDKYINLNSTLVANATTTYYRYNVEFGESFSSEWSFTDYGLNLNFVGGNTGLFQSPQVTPHNFVVGDQVYVSTTSTYTDNRASLTGYFTVIGVVNAYDIVISLTDVGSFPATPGTVVYADNRKVRNLNLSGVTGTTAINVAQDVNEYALTQGDLSAYLMTPSGTTAQFLTNIPRSNFYVTPTQTMFANQLEANPNGYLFFENSNGDIFRAINTVFSGVINRASAIGPSNTPTLTVISGTTGLIKDDTEWYEVWTTGPTPTFEQTSERLRINIDHRCKINDSEILFMDRKGSFTSFALQLRNYDSITTTKEQYKEHIGTFTTTSQGDKTYHSKYEREITYHTNFMSDEMSRYFEEVLTSPYTYVKHEGVWYAAIVQDGTFQTERIKNNTLIRKTITVKFAVNSPINI